ncbi:uncharacterized protein LOC127705643 [Mytilus californianus]|uniref:uncharacterized protein LOC127705643 n=1 Tax=Mytilus californianus TaxID=6549 RepID=UPI002246CB89|nr:uncharacterized protein LOC127705643 [Mytilus californianus]
MRTHRDKQQRTTTKKASGGLEQFCCDNYVKRNGVCVECEAGSKSTNEEPCIPCGQGTYGRKCNSLCKCTINERCDKVSGCVIGNKFVTSNFRSGWRNTLSTNKHTRENTNGYLQHTSTVIRDNSTTGFTKGIVNSPSEEENLISHIATDLKDLQNRTPANTITGTTVRKEHFTKTEIIIYSVGSSSIILIITLLCFVSLWFYNNKRKDSEKGRISTQESHERNANEEAGSLYDSINEDEIYDDNIQIIYSQENSVVFNKQTSDSEGSSQQSGCSGYLHPYTTVTKDFETHSYCTQIKSYDSSNSSSVVDDMKRDSGYTHPYQQIDVEKTIESKAEYSKLVQYLELIDITKPSSMSKSLPNKTLLSSSKLNDQKKYDVGVLSPFSNSNHSHCVINRNTIPSHQSLDFRFHYVSYFSSFFAFDRRGDNSIDNEKISNFKHMSV